MVRVTFPTVGLSFAKSIIWTPTVSFDVSRLRKRKSSLARVIGIIGSKRSSMSNGTIFWIFDV